MLLKYVLAIALTALVLAGCGNVCSDQGKCPKDTAPDSTQVSACQKAESDSACGDKAKALDSCRHDNEQCASDGTSDDLATLGQCTRQLADLQNCCTANPSSVACTSS